MAAIIYPVAAVDKEMGERTENRTEQKENKELDLGHIMIDGRAKIHNLGPELIDSMLPFFWDSRVLANFTSHLSDPSLSFLISNLRKINTTLSLALK